MTIVESLKKHRLQLLVIIPLLVSLYWKIVPAMVRDWARDENYSHGFLVPLIAGYFVYQRWPDVKERLARPDWAGLVVVVLGLLQLLLGWLSAEYFTMRSSLIVLLAGMVLYFFGRQILKLMALPLGYLFFMVPIPYIIYDLAAFPLKMFVTRVSVGALHLLGVIVQREGNIIIFPSITLEVADACSGIRSLLSLLALAVAYAYFIPINTKRRWILIASAVPIAVATNALRVIATGILAQWWGAKAAEGFFHEFAGMAVFALAMVLMVGVGALVKSGYRGSCTGDRDAWKEERQELAAGEQGSKSFLSFKRVTLLYTLLFAAALFINLRTNISVPTNRPFSQFPEQIGSWQMSAQQQFDSGTLKVLKATDYFSRQYKGATGSDVSLYVGFHDGGPESGGIHSPRHCLPGSGWHEVYTRSGTLDTPSGVVDIVRAVYQKGETKEMFLYWFQMMDDTITDEYSLKLTEIKNSILYRRKDQAFIRFSVSVEQDEPRATANLEAFVRDVMPVLREFLPK
ncbi:exosortase A [Pelotalea chapellei]|nr:exosortase A [Pelotalea chapellei]